MSTIVEIDGTDWRINGALTYAGREHQGRRIEGLLLNSRMVQAVFDDTNPVTRRNWSYPDMGVWDPDRNTQEFCDMLPLYRAHGLLGVTVGMQGGGAMYYPEVFENYVNSAFLPDGSLKQPYLDRLAKIVDAADEQGMVVFVNYFYWKQQRFESEGAVRAAVENMTAFEAALDAGVSWGYYDQGYGCGETQTKCDWLERERETSFDDLSGFQTVPINWGVNTPHKRAFFARLRDVTGSGLS